MRAGSIGLAVALSACASPVVERSAPVVVEVAPGRASGSGTPSVRFIPDTAVADTPANRAALAICERYRLALEQRDVEALLSLASTSYHDGAGTPADGSDDVDREGLRAVLEGTFRDVAAIRYELRYRTLIRENAITKVAVTHAYSFLIGEQWKRGVGDNVIELAEEGGVLLIISGM